MQEEMKERRKGEEKTGKKAHRGIDSGSLMFPLTV